MSVAATATCVTVPEFLIETILPSGEINLLGGPSGAGKTRWLFQTLLDWQDGKDILGYKSHPVPWVYVAGDRTMASVMRTMTSMGIDPSRITAIPAWDEKMGISQIQDEITRSGAKLAVIESFGNFVDPPGNSKCVKNFLNPLSASMQRAHQTAIGIMESPKMKPYEKYENPRQRVSGAAAWAHYTETIFMVEPANVKDPSDPARILSVCPRNAKGSTHQLQFSNEGRLYYYP